MAQRMSKHQVLINFYSHFTSFYNTLQHWKLADWTHNGIRFLNGQQTFGQMLENWKNIYIPKVEKCEFNRSL